MSSADLRSAMNYVSQEKANLVALQSKLSGKKMPGKMSVTRNTEGMAGTKYKEQHENVKESFTTFKSSVTSEKSSALEALDAKIGKLETDLENLEVQYNAAVAAEAKAKAERAKNK